MATTTEDTRTNYATRHKSQREALATLDEIRGAIDAMPGHFKVIHTLTYQTIFLTYDDFVAFFAGQKVTRDDVNNCLYTTIGGVRVQSLKHSTTSHPVEVQL